VKLLKQAAITSNNSKNTSWTKKEFVQETTTGNMVKQKKAFSEFAITRALQVCIHSKALLEGANILIWFFYNRDQKKRAVTLKIMQ